MKLGQKKSGKAAESPGALRRLDFVKNNPKVFGSRCAEDIRCIVFQDHIPEAKGCTRYLLKREANEIWAYLTRDRQTLYIGAQGGIDASPVCEGMFKGLGRIERIEFEPGAFYTDKAKAFTRMFEGCQSLKSVCVRGFETGSAREFNHMFDGCESLTALTVSGFDTSNAYDFTGMFRNCKSLQQLDLTNFAIHRGTRYSKLFDERGNAHWFMVPPGISGMFAGCESLTSLDLRSFDTSGVRDFSSLFENCKSLRTLLLGERFVIGSNADTDKMTAGCPNLDLSVFRR